MTGFSSSRRLYQAYYSLMVCPWYAYSQTMISEVSPLPQMCVLYPSFLLLNSPTPGAVITIQCGDKR